MATTKSKSTRKTQKSAPATKKTTINSKSVKTNKPIQKITTNTTIKTVKGPLSPLERIRSVQVSSALVYLIFSGLVVGFVAAADVAVTLGLQTRDQFASQQHTVLGPAHEVLFNLDPKYVLVASLLLSSLFAVLLAGRLRSRYQATLANRTSGFRWLAIGLTAGLTLEYVNLLAGIHDIALLKLSAFMIFITAMLSFIAERDNAGAVRPKWLAFNLSLITGAFAFLPLILSLIGTSLYGMERFGWHVYALAFVLLLGFSAFAANQSSHIKAGSARDYLGVEEKYLRTDLLTKFAVVVITILALK